MKKLLIILIAFLLAVLLFHKCPEPELHTCPEQAPMPVADRQRYLKKAGFYTGRVDGICGRLTHESQLAWEKQEINESVIYWMKRMEIK